MPSSDRSYVIVIQLKAKQRPSDRHVSTLYKLVHYFTKTCQSQLKHWRAYHVHVMSIQ